MEAFIVWSIKNLISKFTKVPLIHKYVVVMFYKVVRKIELANTEPLTLGEIVSKAKFLQDSGHSIFISQPIYNFII
jgi:hypothetical protein